MSILRLPSVEDVAELNRLHRAGRYLDAFHFTRRFAPPEEWRDTAAIVIVGRLMSCWGDSWRSNRCQQRAWTAAPDDPATIYYYALTIEQKHGPFEALRFLHERRSLYDRATPEAYHVWLLLLEARLRATFRDFEAAEALLQAAAPHARADPWFWVEEARLREQQDRYAEALASAEHALALEPTYRPAIETTAHLLTLRTRDAEALALLQRGVKELQAGNLAQTLAILHTELDQPAETLIALDRATEFLPCANQAQRAWLAARRSDALRALGRETEAAAQARLVKSGFHDEIAVRLGETAGPRGRVHLRVNFVRQHHMTCAPATLAALGDFWQRPIDHLELARTICYDGTPDHEERYWAETHGWIAREFRVTWAAAVALLERGVPFTLTTVATRSAHLQAVVGFDARLGLLLIRDPFQRTHGECLGKAFLDGCASHGPRGMVLLPPDRSALLEGIEFPDASLYDAWYALRRALVRHDRGAGQAAVDTLESTAPGQRLTLQAQRELAFYDGNILRQVEATRALLKLYPEDPNFLLDEAQLLRGLGHAKERRERVEVLGRKRNADTLFLREYIEMLADDARFHPRALRLARRMLRRHAVEAGNLRAFANLLWSRQQFTEATTVYRLAACVGDKVEHHWDSFFIASRHTQQVERCLDLLRQRETRLGLQSSQPVRTLFRACETLDRTTEGFAALDAAVTRRPDDGELLLFAAENHARFGRMAESQRLLAAAAGRAASLTSLRTQARLAELRTEHAAALGHWRDLLQLNPVDLPAHTSAATLLARLEGRASAIRFLRTACARHPNQIPLHNTLLEWLRTETPEEALTVADHLLAVDPANAWLLREKALILRRHNRPAEALPLAEEACRIEPSSPSSPGTAGVVLAALGRDREARSAFQEALRLSIDSGYMDELLRVSGDFEERKSATTFLQTELARQPAQDGSAFVRFRETARAVLNPAELRAALETLLGVHAGQWGAWSAYVTHLIDQGDFAAALTHAQSAVERFPLVARAWLDLAAAQSRTQQTGAEIQSLQRALELSPTWGYAVRLLAAAHERALQLDAAEHALHRGIAADPLDPVTHGTLADLLWRRKRKDEAVTLMERALTLDPGYDSAWQCLDQWSHERGESGRAIAFAEELTRTRPGDARAWHRLAQMQFREPATALATLDRSLTIEPRNIDAHDLRAHVLAALGRHDDALAACRPAVFANDVPCALLGRIAWIFHERKDTPTAITHMRTLLGQHPDYTWGWNCLTEWCWELNQFAETVEAATKWAWLAPGDAVAHGFVASAQLRLRQRPEAKAAFWRALRCNPAYTYAAQTLLQMLAEDHEVDEATRVLHHIETHLSPADAQRASVLYNVMRHAKAAAAQSLGALARVPEEKIHLFEESVAAMLQAGWRSTVDDTLSALLTDPEVNPAVGRAWVTAWAPLELWRNLDLFEKRPAPEKIVRQAWAAAIESMGTAKARWRLRRIRYRRSEWLRADPVTWGALGYAFATAGLYRATVSWLSRFPTRGEPQAWMLHNLAIAHYRRKEPADALRIVTLALTLKPDNTRAGLLLWRGIECALSGDLAGAEASRAEAPGPHADDFMKLHAAMLDLLIEFEHAMDRSPQVALQRARKEVKVQWATTASAQGDRALVHLRARVLRRIGRRAGSWPTRAQSYLPSPGWGIAATSPGQSQDFSWWPICFAFLALSSLMRNCSGP